MVQGFRCDTLNSFLSEVKTFLMEATRYVSFDQNKRPTNYPTSSAH